MTELKKYLRSIQTFFPFLHDLRFDIKFILLRMLTKPHESDFEALKYFRPEKDATYVDIGTNRGESLLSIDIINGNKNKVVGFEPNPHVYERAQRALGKRKHIEIHNVGLSNTHGQFELNVPFYRNWMFDGLSSLDYSSAHDWLEHRLWRYQEKHLDVKKVQCEVKKLDDFDLSPYFVKIDVQGLEFEVLQGAQKTLEKFRPILLIESLDQRILDYLKPLGYKCYAYESGKFTEGRGKLNTFCITDDKFETILQQAA